MGNSWKLTRIFADIAVNKRKVAFEARFHIPFSGNQPYFCLGVGPTPDGLLFVVALNLTQFLMGACAETVFFDFWRPIHGSERAFMIGKYFFMFFLRNFAVF